MANPSLSKPVLCNLFFVIFSLLFPSCGYAQYNLPSNAVQVLGGYSRHGSGDLKGVVFGASYIKYISNRFSLDYNFKGTIHDGKQSIIINNTMNGFSTDASVRFTTAGVQAGVTGGWSIIRNPNHELKIGLGGFGRYQSASNGDDGYQLYFPSQTGQPTVLVGYDNRTQQRIFSLGGILQFQYNFTFSNKIYLGIIPGFQTDTNGDAIPQVALTLGKRF